MSHSSVFTPRSLETRSHKILIPAPLEGLPFEMMLGAVTAVSVLDAGRKAWMGVKAVKATAQTVKKYRRAPAEMQFALQLCACLLEALPIAEALATRHRSLALVGSAVQLARTVALEWTTVVDASIDDSEDGWAQFMEAGRKLEVVLQLQSRLALAMNALQLAFATVAASGLPRTPSGNSFAASPFVYLPEAVDVAHSSLQGMEMGRTRSILLAGGELWQRGIRDQMSGKPKSKAAATSADAMKILFTVRLRLHKGTRKRGAEDAYDDDDDDDEEEDEEEEGFGAPRSETRQESTPDRESSDTLALWFLQSCVPGDEENPEDEDEDEGERVIVLDETVRFRRLWSQDLAAELAGKNGADFLEIVGAHTLCYEFTPSTHPSANKTRGASRTPLVLTFQMEVSRRGSGGHFSAETFEALVFLALLTRRTAARSARGAAASTPRSIPLSDAYDPDNPRPFVAALAAQVGPLDGVPGTAEGGKSRSGDDVLVTPMRGLGLS